MTSSACNLGLTCGFPIGAGCGAQGVCIDVALSCEDDAAACSGGGTACGCGGGPVSVVIAGYASGPSPSGASVGGPCPADSGAPAQMVMRAARATAATEAPALDDDERSECGNEPGDPSDEAVQARRAARASIHRVEHREEIGRTAAFPVEDRAPPIATRSMLDARARRERLQARMSKVIRALVVLLVLAGIGVGAWRYRLAHKAPDITYKTVPLEKHRVVGKVTASGTLSALVTVIVGTQVFGPGSRSSTPTSTRT